MDRLLTKHRTKVNRVANRMKTVVFILLVALGFAVGVVHAQNELNLIPDVVDPAKLIPILPEPPAGWTAEKAEGSSDDVGGFKITKVPRGFEKRERGGKPRAPISHLEFIAKPQ